MDVQWRTMYLVGMGAIVMDDAVVGSNSVIAAGAVVLPGTIVEPGSIYAGTPAKRIKDISDEMREVISTNCEKLSDVCRMV